MQLIRTNATLLSALQAQRQQGKRIGFVPTMGALHQGHISLIRISQQQTDFTVCSLFVNPTQFNDKKDLENYPRTEASDCEALAAVNCDLVYIPTVEEIYPPDLISPHFDFGELATVMEGKMRPGHFAGMAQVVHRLLDLVNPDALFMGQKDLQQFTIVKRMLQLMNSPIDLVCCPIVRENDGLAMSSRNVRLTTTERSLAPIIYSTLKSLKDPNYRLHFATPTAYIEHATKALNETNGMSVEYVSIVDTTTLQACDNWTNSAEKACCIAVRLGAIRLIDNVLFK